MGPHFFKSRTEKIGVTGRFHADNLPPFIVEMIGEGLTEISETKTVEPMIATSWESPDKGKTWIFNLSGDFTWHDEKPVESGDLTYKFSDVEIERPDTETIIFKLQEPFSPFPSIVSRPIFVKGLLGTGKWEVEGVTLAGSNVSELTLVNKEGSKKVFKFYPTEQRTRLAYKLGKVDSITNIFDPKPLDSWSTADVKNNLDLGKVVTLFYNTKDADLSDKSLRQALAYAIDKNSLSGERAISPISKNSWAYNSKVKDYEHDAERAKEVVNEIEKDRGELSVKLVSTPILLSVAENIEKYWEEAGIDTTIQVSSVVPEDFQVYLAFFDIPNDPDQYSVWHSTQTISNISNYSSPRIDKLLEDGRTELMLEERKKIYLDFQRFLLEDLPAVFLYYPNTYTISRK